jgi:hypothetical protein
MFSRGSVSAEMAILSAQAGTSTTHRFTQGTFPSGPEAFSNLFTASTCALALASRARQQGSEDHWPEAAQP